MSFSSVLTKRIFGCIIVVYYGEKMMLNIAIVEDEKTYSDILEKYIDKYGKEENEDMRVFVFRNAIDLLSDYKAGFDIIFMDIELPELDGMTASRKLRETDQSTVLVFVTNMAQYAVNGYEVGAFDYIVKPVNYYDFYMKLRRAAGAVRARDNKKISITKAGGYVRVFVRDIKYIDVLGHKVRYHLADGGTVEEYASLSDLERKLAEDNFVRCNNYCLVNLPYITRVRGLSVWIGDEEIAISHPKKKKFMQEVNAWLARGNG